MTTADTAPQNLEAEENVLGAILLGGSALDAVSEILSPGDFYRASHALVYEAAIELSQASIPIDPITLVDVLERKGQLDTIGGRQRVQELAALVPASANAAHYARIVKDNSAARALILAGHNIARLGYEKPGSLDALMAQAEEQLSAATGNVISSSFTPLTDSLQGVLDDIAAAYDGKPNKGLTTGYTELDQKLGGLRPGQLVLIAARPGAGKSALVQNIAENLADAEKRVAFLTLEMSGDQLNQRSLARASGLDLNRIRWGNPPADSKDRLRAAAKTVLRRKEWLYVNEDSSVNPTTLRAQLRRLQRKPGLDLAIIDYIQLMTTGQHYDNRQVEVAAISRSLKLLAKDLHVPVIALSQMSRAIEGRAKEDRRPQLSDLRESGALEQDADVVLFIHRDESDHEGGVAEIIIAKNRMGETNSVRLAYVGRKYTFSEIPKGES